MICALPNTRGACLVQRLPKLQDAQGSCILLVSYTKGGGKVTRGKSASTAMHRAGGCRHVQRRRRMRSRNPVPDPTEWKVTLDIALKYGFQVFNKSSTIPDQPFQYTAATKLAADHVIKLLQDLWACHAGNADDDSKRWRDCVSHLYKVLILKPYTKWLRAVQLRKLVNSAPGYEEEGGINQLQELALYILIYTECANLRLTPELMWFLFHCGVHHRSPLLKVYKAVSNPGTALTICSSAQDVQQQQQLWCSSLLAVADATPLPSEHIALLRNSQWFSALLSYASGAPKPNSHTWRRAGAGAVADELWIAELFQQYVALHPMNIPELQSATTAPVQAVAVRLAVAALVHGDSHSFLDQVVQPIFHVFSEQIAVMGIRQEEPAIRLGYDDLNECFMNPAIVHHVLERITQQGGTELEQMESAWPMLFNRESDDKRRVMRDRMLELHQATIEARLEDTSLGALWRHSRRGAQWWSHHAFRKTFVEQRSLLAPLVAFGRIYHFHIVWFYLLCVWGWVDSEHQKYWAAVAAVIHAGATALLLSCRLIFLSRPVTVTRTWDAQRGRWVHGHARSATESQQLILPAYQATNSTNHDGAMRRSWQWLYGARWWACMVIVAVFSWAIFGVLALLAAVATDAPVQGGKLMVSDGRLVLPIKWFYIACGAYGGAVLVWHGVIRVMFQAGAFPQPGSLHPEVADLLSCLFPRHSLDAGNFFTSVELHSTWRQFFGNALLWTAALGIKLALDRWVLIYPLAGNLRQVMQSNVLPIYGHGRRVSDLDPLLAALQITVVFLVSMTTTGFAYTVVTSVWGVIQGMTLRLGAVKSWHDICSIFPSLNQLWVDKFMVPALQQQGRAALAASLALTTSRQATGKTSSIPPLTWRSNPTAITTSSRHGSSARSTDYHYSLRATAAAAANGGMHEALVPQVAEPQGNKGQAQGAAVAEPFADIARLLPAPGSFVPRPSRLATAAATAAGKLVTSLSIKQPMQLAGHHHTGAEVAAMAGSIIDSSSCCSETLHSTAEVHAEASDDVHITIPTPQAAPTFHAFWNSIVEFLHVRDLISLKDKANLLIKIVHLPGINWTGPIEEFTFTGDHMMLPPVATVAALIPQMVMSTLKPSEAQTRVACQSVLLLMWVLEQLCPEVFGERENAEYIKRALFSLPNYLLVVPEDPRHQADRAKLLSHITKAIAALNSVMTEATKLAVLPSRHAPQMPEAPQQHQQHQQQHQQHQQHQQRHQQHQQRHQQYQQHQQQQLHQQQVDAAPVAAAHSPDYSGVTHTYGGKSMHTLSPMIPSSGAAAAAGMPRARSATAGASAAPFSVQWYSAASFDEDSSAGLAAALVATEQLASALEAGQADSIPADVLPADTPSPELPAQHAAASLQPSGSGSSSSASSNAGSGDGVQLQPVPAPQEAAAAAATADTVKASKAVQQLQAKIGVAAEEVLRAVHLLIGEVLVTRRQGLASSGAGRQVVDHVEEQLTKVKEEGLTRVLGAMLDRALELALDKHSDVKEVLAWLTNILTTAENAARPNNKEALRILTTWCSSLANPLVPKPDTVLRTPSVTSIIPFYAEDVLYAFDAQDAAECVSMDPKFAKMDENNDCLFDASGRPTELLKFLQSQFSDEWHNFLERMREQYLKGSGPITEEAFKRGQPLHSRRLDLVMWATVRGQLLGRTVDGMMMYRQGLLLHAQMEVPQPLGMSGAEYNALIEELVDRKYSCVVTCQMYADHKADRQNLKAQWIAYSIDLLMAMYPKLQVAYIDTQEVVPCSPEGVVPNLKFPSWQFKVHQTYSVLMGSKRSEGIMPGQYGQLDPLEMKQVLADGAREEKYRVRHPINFSCPKGGEISELLHNRLVGVILGEGKPENHNQAMMFCHGRLLQTVDMNQDNTLAEALKLRNVAQEFYLSKPGSSSTVEPQQLPSGKEVALVGLPEYVFSNSCGLCGDLAAAVEKTFGTQIQRVMVSPSDVRFHYGHPDIWNRLFIMTRGGVSKATKSLHVSEDVFGGYNACRRGGVNKYAAYMTVGKGRDMGLTSINTFEAKISQGGGEQMFTRDLRHLGSRFDFFRSMSLYFTGPGFFINSTISMFSVYLSLWVSLLWVMTKVETFNIASGAYGAIQILQLGAIALTSNVFVMWLEMGLLKAVIEMGRQLFSGGLVFAMIRSQTQAHYFSMGFLYGGAAYLATGRGFSLKRLPFVEMFKLYGRSHMYFGMEMLIMLIITLIIGSSAGVSVPVGALWSPGLVAISLLFGFFWFNPFYFKLSQVLRDMQQFVAWMHDRMQQDAQLGSWTAWNTQQLAQVRNDKGVQLPAGRLSAHLLLVGWSGVIFGLSALASVLTVLSNNDSNQSIYGTGWQGSLLFVAICSAVGWCLITFQAAADFLCRSRPTVLWRRYLQALSSVLLLAGVLLVVVYGLFLGDVSRRLGNVVAILFVNYQTVRFLLCALLAVAPQSPWCRSIVDNIYWQSDLALAYFLCACLWVACLLTEIGIVLLDRVQVLALYNERYAKRKHADMLKSD